MQVCVPILLYDAYYLWRYPRCIATMSSLQVASFTLISGVQYDDINNFILIINARYIFLLKRARDDCKVNCYISLREHTNRYTRFLDNCRV